MSCYDCPFEHRKNKRKFHCLLLILSLLQDLPHNQGENNSKGHRQKSRPCDGQPLHGDDLLAVLWEHMLMLCLNKQLNFYCKVK